jgi:hypothetical protein
MPTAHRLNGQLQQQQRRRREEGKKLPSLSRTAVAVRVYVPLCSISQFLTPSNVVLELRGTRPIYFVHYTHILRYNIRK